MSRFGTQQPEGLLRSQLGFGKLQRVTLHLFENTSEPVRRRNEAAEEEFAGGATIAQSSWGPHVPRRNNQNVSYKKTRSHLPAGTRGTISKESPPLSRQSKCSGLVLPLSLFFHSTFFFSSLLFFVLLCIAFNNFQFNCSNLSSTR